MEYDEKNEIAWRAFYLGMRTAMQAFDLKLTTESIPTVMGLASRIATSDFTLSEPSANLAGLSGPTKQIAHDISSSTIRSDRDLAHMVVNGFNRACQTENG